MDGVSTEFKTHRWNQWRANEAKEDKMMQVYRDIRAKGIKLGKRLHELPEVANKHVSLDKRGKLHFPVLILYDEFMVTDFIEDF